VSSQHRVDLPSLTGLRYLAAAAVVFCHGTHVLGLGTLTEQFARIGYVGVEFFFVLSGFVLTWSRSTSDSVSKAAFYRRRFARIYPLYITTWIAFVVAAQIVNLPDQSMLGAALGVIMIQAWFPQKEIFQAGNTPGWSLSAEAFFYALFPFLVDRLPRWRWTSAVLVGLVLVAGAAYSLSSAYSVWFAYYSPIYGLLYFVIGMTLAAHVRTGRSIVPELRVCLALLVLCFVAIGAVAPDSPKGLAEAIMLPAIALVIVSAGRADLSGAKTMWSRSFVVRLGQWSFALYLVHWPILGLLSKVGSPKLDSLSTALATLGVLVLATAVAACAYYLLERPVERWIRGAATREPAELSASSAQSTESGSPAEGEITLRTRRA
jgi:peptidoglycan/LPS O-acetylase OafA/YrhL